MQLHASVIQGKIASIGFIKSKNEYSFYINSKKSFIIDVNEFQLGNKKSMNKFLKDNFKNAIEFISQNRPTKKTYKKLDNTNLEYENKITQLENHIEYLNNMLNKTNIIKLNENIKDNELLINNLNNEINSKNIILKDVLNDNYMNSNINNTDNINEYLSCNDIKGIFDLKSWRFDNNSRVLNDKYKLSKMDDIEIKEFIKSNIKLRLYNYIFIHNKYDLSGISDNRCLFMDYDYKIIDNDLFNEIVDNLYNIECYKTRTNFWHSYKKYDSRIKVNKYKNKIKEKSLELDSYRDNLLDYNTLLQQESDIDKSILNEMINNIEYAIQTTIDSIDSLERSIERETQYLNKIIK